MNIALWIVASLLAALFVAPGTSKVVLSRDQLLAKGYAWVEDFSPSQVRLVGAVEVVGGIGLILPAALGVIEILSPTAAIGLGVTMVLAALVHVRRHELERLAGTLVLALLTTAVGALRLGPCSF